MNTRFRRNWLAAVGFTLLMVALVIPAQAQKTYSFPKSKPAVTISVPESWVERNNDEDYFEAASKGEEIYVGLWMFEKATSLTEAAKMAGGEIGTHLKDVKVNEKEDTEDFNGMKCVTVEGTGKYKQSGEPCEWEISLFTPNGKDIYALLYYGDPGADKDPKFKDDVEMIVKSVKKK